MAKENAQPGVELAVPDDIRPMPAPNPELANKLYGAILDGKPLPQIGDPELANRMILQEMVQSDSFDKVFQAQTLNGWQDFALDEPVIVYSFHTNPSRFEGGSTAYAVVEIGYPDGDGVEQRALVTVGGQKVLVQLVKAWQNGWLPLKVKLTSKQTSTEGRSVLGLEPV